MITITLPDGKLHSSNLVAPSGFPKPPVPVRRRSLIRPKNPRPPLNRRRFLETAAAATTVGCLLGPGIPRLRSAAQLWPGHRAEFSG
jgi:hypothetical protein